VEPPSTSMMTSPPTSTAPGDIAGPWLSLLSQFSTV
jgi:hypothetical protein